MSRTGAHENDHKDDYEAKPTQPQNRIEHRQLRTPHAVTIDLAKDLRERTKDGRAIILAERPIIFYALLRRQWMRLGRLLLLERARTIETTKVSAYVSEIIRMRDLEFSLSPATAPEATVLLLNFNEWSHVPQDLKTVYICQQLDHDQLQRLLRRLPRTVKLIRYSATGKPLT